MSLIRAAVFLLSYSFLCGKSVAIIDGDVENYYTNYCKLTVYPEDYSMLTHGSGILITYSHIITSGTLVSDAYQVVIGYGSNVLSELEEVSYFPKITIHPDYNRETFTNDIALITLPVPLPTSWALIPIAPNRYQTDFVWNSTTCTTRGFGYRPEDDHWVKNERLSSMRGYYVNDTQCRELLGDRSELISSTHFCMIQTTPGYGQVCHGDQGAGAQISNRKNVGLVAGVLSVVTNMCERTFPSLFTRVSLYYDWLEEVVNSDGVYPGWWDQ